MGFIERDGSEGMAEWGWIENSLDPGGDWLVFIGISVYGPVCASPEDLC